MCNISLDINSIKYGDLMVKKQIPGIFRGFSDVFKDQCDTYLKA